MQEPWLRRDGVAGYLTTSLTQQDTSLNAGKQDGNRMETASLEVLQPGAPGSVHHHLPLDASPACPESLISSGNSFLPPVSPSAIAKCLLWAGQVLGICGEGQWYKDPRQSSALCSTKPGVVEIRTGTVMAPPAQWPRRGQWRCWGNSGL